MTPHGTDSGYKNHKCRCDECCAAHAIAQREWRAKVATRPVPNGVPHGNVNTYDNYSCRCSECTAARTAESRAYREARKATS